MKKYLYIKTLILISLLAVCFSEAFAGVAKIENIKSVGKVTELSAANVAGGDALDKLNKAGMSVFHTVKVVLSMVFLMYLIYLGFQMISSMGADDKLSAAKRQIYYTVLAFLFINIPGSLFDVFSGKKASDITDKGTGFKEVVISNSDENTFINFNNWNSTIELGVISFIKVIVVGVTIMFFMMGGIGLISSGGNDEKRKKARSRFLNGLMGLIFIGLIQVWTQVVYDGKITEGQNTFGKIANLALFFAGPTAIFFLILGGFYYITSAGDDAKAKKGVSIIKNTFVATIILLGCYAFIKDLGDFTL